MATSGGRIVVALGILLGLGSAGCEESHKHLQAFLLQPRSPVAVNEYRVLPPDVLQITSIQVPDINNVKQQVSPDGKINLPLLGEVYVADHTPEEIEKILIEKSREFYDKADATVQVADYRSQKIYVFGQVTRPGPIPFTGSDTLIDVLAQVQPTTMAWPERIRLARAKQPQRGGYLPDKALEEYLWNKYKDSHDAEAPPAQDKDAAAREELERQALKGPLEEADVVVVDLMAMMEKGKLSKNVLLRPNDVIYVPPNPLAAIGLAIQQLLLPMQPAIQTVQLPASAIYSVESVQNFKSSKSLP
jgi:protein involved in polysaccharide export with SLBB domain